MFRGNMREMREIWSIGVQQGGAEKNITCKNRWNR